MINMDELPEDIGEQIHRAILREKHKKARGKQILKVKLKAKTDEAQGISHEQYQELIKRQCRLEDDLELIRDGLEAAKAASEPRSQRVLATGGTAFLLAPLCFLTTWLLAMVLQRMTGSGGIHESMLLACLICAVLGLLLLVLAQRVSGDPLKNLLHWLSDD